VPGPRLFASLLTALALGYIAWKIGQAPTQALQFAFNGLAVGAVYALLAIGFTLVYSTVWFFDLYYGAAAALGAYGVFYLRTDPALGSRLDINSVPVNVVFGAVVAGVVAWTLYTVLEPRLRERASPTAFRAVLAVVAVAMGIYTAVVLSYPEHLHLTLSPAVGLATAVVAISVAQRAVRQRVVRTVVASVSSTRVALVAAVPASTLGAWCGYLLTNAPGAGLYLSWAVSCLLAGCVGLALYRGLYAYMRERARSPLIMLVASLGILLAIAALIVIVFQSAPRPLPDAFGSTPWNIAGARIKGFNVFAIGVALAGFAGMWFLLKMTSFGRAVRAIGDDEEVSKVVGINTTVIIAIVFFIGAVYAAMAGILTGHDTAVQPRMGLLLLLKGWIASVVGGIGNLYGAIVGGFVLGLVEQFGIWDLAGEWKDAISFVLLILFLSFWPQGLLPRR
jgi:branched-chain amino acid transport system permease protein